MATNEEELQEFLRENHPKTPGTLNKVDTRTAQKVLTQLNFSKAAQNIILNPESLNNEGPSLVNVALSNELLTAQVRSSLGAIIDSLEQNPSFVSRLTKYWGSLTLWEKIIGGIALSGSTLVAFPIADLGFLLALSGLSAGVYITGGAVLQDHLEHTQSLNDRLKKGIFSIADVLVLTITALDTIRQKLAQEVEKFQQENQRLTKNVGNLSEQIDGLRVQIECYMITEKHLRKTQIELEQTAEKLKLDLHKNQKIYDETIKQIEAVKADKERCTQLLSSEVIELSKKRVELEAELEKTQALVITLTGTVNTLSSVAIGDIQQRKNFQARLEGFLENKEKSFADMAERICKAEVELVSVRAQLEESLARHEELMKSQSDLIARLERIDLLIPEEPLIRDEKLAPIDVLCSVGFMSPFRESLEQRDTGNKASQGIKKK